MLSTGHVGGEAEAGKGVSGRGLTFKGTDSRSRLPGSESWLEFVICRRYPCQRIVAGTEWVRTMPTTEKMLCQCGFQK